jgi:nucleotidyltransferase substrate binding protein (TIGR01987 family)
MTDDIRWIQRLNNWTRALNQLSRFMEREELDELQEQGLIQSFEYNHELAWMTQKDFLENEGVRDLFGSKTVAREAMSRGLTDNGEVWMKMIEDRNLTSHTYNEEVTKQIVGHIIEEYFAAFTQLHQKMSTLAKDV